MAQARPSTSNAAPTHPDPVRRHRQQRCRQQAADRNSGLTQTQREAKMMP